MVASSPVIQLSLIVPLAITLLVRFTTGKVFQRRFHSIFPWLCGLYCLLFPLFTWEVFTKDNSDVDLVCGLYNAVQLLMYIFHLIVMLPVYILIVYGFTRVLIKEDLDNEERAKITDAERDKW